MKAVERLSFPLAIATGGLLGILILSGHPQVFVYVSYTLGLYSLFCMAEQFRKNGFNVSLLRLATVSTVVIITGVCLAAVNLLPLFDLINHTLRPNVTYEIATSYALHPQELITLLMPDFYGRAEPSNWDYWGPGWSEYGHFWETNSYFGILPLVFVCVSFTLKRTRLTFFMGILAILTCLLSLGDATPIFRVAYETIPGFDRFRSPGRLNILSGFAVAILSGISIDALCRLTYAKRLHLMRIVKVACGLFVFAVIIYIAAEEPITVWLSGGTAFQDRAKEAMATQAGPFTLLLLLSIVFLFACTYHKIHHSVLVIAAAVLIFFDLYAAGHEFNASPHGPAYYYPRSSIIKFLEKQQAEQAGRARTRDGAQFLMRRNAGMLYRVFTLEGYVSPLRLANTTPPVYSDELMNVKYRIKVDQDSQNIGLAANPNTMPQAYIVRNYVVAADREAVAKAMADSTFDYRTTVTLDMAPSLKIAPESFPAMEQPSVVHYEPNNMRIIVDMKEAGLLIVGEVFYPDWQAYVDGRSERIYRANDTMRAIPLSGGTHTVELRYESGSFRIGVMISCVMLVVVLFNLGMLLRRRK
ncbi:MAG: YfhO family protein [Gemmatimonadota bacterium]|nr:YfhO family protein [Gemmatimonadota bacterium]